MWLWLVPYSYSSKWSLNLKQSSCASLYAMIVGMHPPCGFQAPPLYLISFAVGKKHNGERDGSTKHVKSIISFYYSLRRNGGINEESSRNGCGADS